MNGSLHLPLTVNANLVTEAGLPTDGSTFSYDFSAFCCPGITRVAVVALTSSPVAEPWDVRVVVARTGEVVMQSNGGFGREGSPYLDVLGGSFLETFRIEAEPVQGLPMLGTYEIRIQVGWEL